MDQSPLRGADDGGVDRYPVDGVLNTGQDICMLSNACFDHEDE
jgi:hypothetical protein